MSWEIFKQNILNVANSPEGIPDIDTIADLYAKEYDAAIKRGGDSINNVSVKRGNVDAMRELFRAALQKGLNSKVGYDLVGEMGQGVLAYWSGATLNEFPIPKVPATGATQNTSVTSNIVTNPGSWQPVVNADPPPPSDEEFELSEEDIAVKKEELADAKVQAQNGDETAFEYVAKIEEELDNSRAFSIDAEPPVVVRPRFVARTYRQVTNTEFNQLDPNRTYSSGEIGTRIVAAATADIGVMETRNAAGKFVNSGGAVNPNGMLKEVGVGGRIDYMHKLNGLDNLAKLREKGDGYHWCASAVATWWKEAGIAPKVMNFWTPLVANWVPWAQKNGLWSTTPVIGAAIIYRGGPNGYSHIGIVASVINGVITTIEGNTGGGGFNRNGCGVFSKTPDLKRVAGYVIPPGASISLTNETQTNSK